MTTATAVLMTVADVAGELEISQPEVLRLIAKLRLPATRVGDGENGHWKVRRDAFNAFVAKQPERMRLPEFNERDATGWFDNSLNYLSYGFENAFRAAAEEQIPSNEDLVRYFEQRPQSMSEDFRIQRTGKVAELLQRDVPNAIYGETPTGKRETRFLNWRDLYATVKLRDVAEQVIRGKPSLTLPIARLYDSPDAYGKIAGEAYQQAANRNLVSSVQVSVMRGNSVTPESCTAYYIYPLSEILTPANRDRYYMLAF